ncbi:MAG: DUF2917 domain-containing protein [Hyphomicrobiales bacterium]|nr:DUF2917 domain-containing protein [Hyphomicrobiales bacterium]
MHALTQSMDYHLERSQQWPLRAANRQRLTVRDGHVWLTQGDGSEDHVLAAGDSAMIEDGGKPIASALGGPAAFDLTPAHDEITARAA